MVRQHTPSDEFHSFLFLENEESVNAERRVYGKISRLSVSKATAFVVSTFFHGLEITGSEDRPRVCVVLIIVYDARNDEKKTFTARRALPRVCNPAFYMGARIFFSNRRGAFAL